MLLIRKFVKLNLNGKRKNFLNKGWKKNEKFGSGIRRKNRDEEKFVRDEEIGVEDEEEKTEGEERRRSSF